MFCFVTDHYKKRIPKTKRRIIYTQRLYFRIVGFLLTLTINGIIILDMTPHTVWFRFRYEHVHDTLLAMLLLAILDGGYLDAHAESHLNVSSLLHTYIHTYIQYIQIHINTCIAKKLR